MHSNSQVKLDWIITRSSETPTLACAAEESQENVVFFCVVVLLYALMCVCVCGVISYKIIHVYIDTCILLSHGCVCCLFLLLFVFRDEEKKGIE